MVVKYVPGAELKYEFVLEDEAKLVAGEAEFIKRAEEFIVARREMPKDELVIDLDKYFGPASEIINIYSSRVRKVHTHILALLKKRNDKHDIVEIVTKYYATWSEIVTYLKDLKEHKDLNKIYEQLLSKMEEFKHTAETLRKLIKTTPEIEIIHSSIADKQSLIETIKIILNFETPQILSI